MLKVAFIQNEVIWEDREANFAYYDTLLDKLSEKVDLLVLCEMCDTGFTMNPDELSFISFNEVKNKYLQLASTHQIAIMGTSAIQDKDGVFRNRAIMATAGPQEVQFYDKVHLFTPTGEARNYTAGLSHKDFRIGNVRIRPLICYDLRFPYLSFQENQYDLLVYMANWPASRIIHWDQLLMARAIENQVFTLGVNRIGSDENGLSYPGHTQIIDYAGHIMYHMKDCGGIKVMSLDLEKQQDYRNALPFKNDIKTGKNND